MLSKNPFFSVEIVPVVAIGPVKYAIVRCPRCLKNIGINDGMKAGVESIICKGQIGKVICNAHFYLHGDSLEFLGTV